ncbi:uncharacterized protein LOC132697117 [Cylas formicarius]|uniref:uncharacterized protein LOC132697117 n=1 Tax=Cylas formicarius TaxID=197179 RepID=UPI0029583992|nr:uncharacterized protein LOC132697117 [Cylas formicarius]
MYQSFKRTFISVNSQFLNKSVFEISEEVKSALSAKKAVVALESAIITHGMPYPENIQCALEVENVVRTQGAVPATVALLDGKIKVGLTRPELEKLGDTKISKPIKTSRRDFPYVLSNKRNGGTTVAGTIIVCNASSITFFATGGIGGVHKKFEKTLDISADLPELGRSNVAVISSGVKSILDIPKTLEYLETLGVFIASFGQDARFPAFYSRSSRSNTPYSVSNAYEAAKIVKAHKSLKLESGLLFAVPVPEEHELPFDFIDKITNQALMKLDGEAQLQGKDVTPFLLAEIAKATSGASIKTNVALVKNNAKVAGEIALQFSKLERKETEINAKSNRNGDAVIIGGCNLDCTVRLEDGEFKTDGRIHFGKFTYTPGGVGRNICEALEKLGCNTNFISAVGDDHQGRMLTATIPKKSLKHVAIQDNHSSAQCIVALDNEGQCLFLMGDMRVHSNITPKLILENEEVFSNSPLIIIDSNIGLDTMEAVFKIAKKSNIAVFYEPTDVTVAEKPFCAQHWDSIKFITPNVNEFVRICEHFNLQSQEKIDGDLKRLSTKARALAKYIDNVIITLGPDGVLIARKELSTDSTNDISVRHYPTKRVEHFANGLPEEICVSVGLSAALTALHSQAPVAERILDENHPSWTTYAEYTPML